MGIPFWREGSAKADLFIDGSRPRGNRVCSLLVYCGILCVSHIEQLDCTLSILSHAVAFIVVIVYQSRGQSWPWCWKGYVSTTFGLCVPLSMRLFFWRWVDSRMWRGWGRATNLGLLIGHHVLES